MSSKTTVSVKGAGRTVGVVFLVQMLLAIARGFSDATEHRSSCATSVAL